MQITCSKELPSFAVIILLRCNFNFINKICSHWFEFLYTNFIEDSFVKAMKNTVCPRGWNCSKNWISLRDAPFLTYFASKFVACRINIVQKGFILWNGRFCRFRDFKLLSVLCLAVCYRSWSCFRFARKIRTYRLCACTTRNRVLASILMPLDVILKLIQIIFMQIW